MDNHFERVFDVVEPVRVEVAWTTSTDLTLSTHERGRVAVRVDGATPDDVTVELREGGVLAVTRVERDAPRGGWLRALRRGGADIDIQVPCGSSLRLDCAAGDVTVGEDVTSIEGRLGSGDLCVERCDSVDVEVAMGDVDLHHVSGPVRLKAGNGDVDIDVVGGSATVTTGTGDVVLHQVQGAVTVRSGSGDVKVGKAGAGCHVDLGCGDLDADEIVGDVQVRSGSGDITIMAIMTPCEARFSTATGDVTIGVAPHLKVWTDIRTVTGDVDLRLTPRGEPVGVEPFVSITGTTASGDVLVRDA